MRRKVKFTKKEEKTIEGDKRTMDKRCLHTFEVRRNREEQLLIEKIEESWSLLAV